MIKFGTDGWRAVIAEDFTFDNVKIVTQAIADYLKAKKKRAKKIVIGYDRRFLSREFAECVACVLAANNIKVVLSVEAIPTPTISFHCLYSKYDLGVVITASHNPSKFNGLKIKTPQGGSAGKDITGKIESLLGKTTPKHIDLEQAKNKNLIKVKDLTQSHKAFIRKFVDLERIKKLKLNVLADVMYGTGDKFAQSILGSCGIKIEHLHSEFNPSFGGIHPEPVESNLTEMISKMKKGKYDLGLVLDGDADRIAMLDSQGNYINAQVLLPFLAIHMIKNKKNKLGIAKTVVGSNVIDKVAISLGVPCYETPIGFKHISNLFQDNLICIGGEEAGGIGVKGYIPERDGSVSFLLILEMLAYEGKSFDTLISEFYKQYGHYYYSRTAIPANRLKKSLESMKLPNKLYGKPIERVNTLDGIKLITKDNWLMFRKSGTEPIVRVYAESRSKKEGERLVALGKRMIYVL